MERPVTTTSAGRAGVQKNKLSAQLFTIKV
jgi:hypothetical protein